MPFFDVLMMNCTIFCPIINSFALVALICLSSGSVQWTLLDCLIWRRSKEALEVSLLHLFLFYIYLNSTTIVQMSL